MKNEAWCIKITNSNYSELFEHLSKEWGLSDSNEIALSVGNYVLNDGSTSWNYISNEKPIGIEEISLEEFRKYTFNDEKTAKDYGFFGLPLWAEWVIKDRHDIVRWGEGDIIETETKCGTILSFNGESGIIPDEYVPEKYKNIKSDDSLIKA